MLKMPRSNQDPCLSTIAVAALVGGLVGAVVGLMVAPKSGKALRQGIHQKTDNVIGRVENVTLHHAETLKHQGADLAVKGKQLADDLQTFIQESLKNKKVTFQVSQSEEPLQPSEVQVSVEPETPLQEN